MAFLPYYSMGDRTLRVSMDLFKENRRRLAARLRRTGSPDDDLLAKSLVVLQGGSTHVRYDTTAEIAPFRQESFFHWAFGVTEPGCYAVIHVVDNTSILFIPRLSVADSTRRGGFIPSPEDFKRKYDVDQVNYVDEICDVLEQINPGVLLLLNGVNEYTGLSSLSANFDGIDRFMLDNTTLYNEMVECRVVKTDMELHVLRYAARIAAEALKKVMRSTKPGMYEYQLESIFLDDCLTRGGMRHYGYPAVTASGMSSANLSYGRFSSPSTNIVQPGDMCMFDFSSEYYCYTTDITCTYPANGVFSCDQALIYKAVLNSNRTVIKACKPGVYWPDMYTLGVVTLLEGLRDAGLVQGDVTDMMRVHLGKVFMPHSVGHMLGVDVMDVGGCPADASESERLLVQTTRAVRVLHNNMVITVEPGCYFMPSVLEEAFKDEEKSNFLCEARIREFIGTGGMRVEDTIIITPDGAEIITKVPRTVEEIQTWMS